MIGARCAENPIIVYYSTRCDALMLLILRVVRFLLPPSPDAMRHNY